MGLRTSHAAATLNPVVIVGGGLSGLAAGVGLSSRGIPVLLLEQRPALGGRASSFIDEVTGDVIDNGQHVLIAGYVRTMRFLETIGTQDRLAVQKVPTLLFHHPRRGFCTFRQVSLPPPLNLFGGIILTDLFSTADKFRLLRAGAALRSFREEGSGAAAGMTVAQWLDAVGQSSETERSWWEPLAIAIMNEHIDVASALVFIRSLRTAFLAHPRGAALALPTVGLSELYVDAARSFIERHAGEVRCRTDVVATLAGEEGMLGVRTKEGEEIGCSALILAVPSLKAPALLPAHLREAGFLSEIESIPMSPIVSIHLWFRTDFMRQDHLGVIGKRIQWVFNRRRICREEAKAGGGHVSVVISAGYEEAGMTNEQLSDLAWEDLRDIYGRVVSSPTHTVVLRERRATISCQPAVEKIRPGPRTPVHNLFLAGDWTATGYPSTIEGAITSGDRCVDLVAAFLGRTP